jgi:PAS domain S-box-containing protein
VIVLVPYFYFLFSRQFVLGTMEAQAELSARSISGIVMANPKTWIYEQVRLSELLERQPLTNIPQTRRIYDADDELVAESTAALASPTVVMRAPIYDAGTEIGRIEITQSLQPLVTRTLGAELTALLAAALLILAVRLIPLRAIANAERAAEKSEQRLQAEAKAAAQAREQLTMAIEQSAEIVMLTDAAGTIQYVNPVFETVTGYTRAETIGRNPRLIKSGMQDENFYRGLWETVTAGRVWQGRFINRRKDGSLFTLDATISPVHDETGRIVSYVAVNRDVTEHLRHAKERARLEDQLRQAQKVEAIGQLAGGVAHDFNNMTAIVLGYGEMLLGQLGPADPSRKLVEQIVAAGRRSAALTRQLLAFSRRQTLQPVVLDLNALLRNLEEMLARLIGEDILLELLLAENLGCITADPGQIDQVVTNLVVNARDAMPKGGRLTVETANVELDATFAQGHQSVVPGRYVLFALTDSGVGMDKVTRDRLFEPFFTTKPKGKGTGLGLATVYGIVKQSGGYIYVYSESGAGATFKIYLPLTDARPAGKPVETGERIPRGNGELILLVDDEAPLRELAEIILKRLGYRVGAAGSGAAALRMLREQELEPALVLTDVIMPGMSGSELADQVRRERPGLRVLFMSGYTDDAIASHGVLDSGTNFIQKPFTERALATKVWEVLSRTENDAQPRRSVLMIDDDEQFRELVRHYCAKGGHLFAGVESAAAALATLAKQSFDVLLVDVNIPGTSGERVLREIRAAGHTMPAIMLTGDVASADMDVLRPLGAVQALEKSSRREPLLQAIAAAVAPEITTGRG